MKITPPATSRASSRQAKHAPRRRAIPSEPVSTPFHAFIAYADVPAAGAAMSTIEGVLRATGGKHSLKPMLWRFNQLTDAKWRDRAIIDAAQASVVVLASTSAHTLTPELESWVGGFLAYQRGGRTTLVALFGTEDAWTISIEEPQACEAQEPSCADQQLVA